MCSSDLTRVSPGVVKGAVHVAGAGARPLILRCRLHDGSASGVVFTDSACGRVEQCDFRGLVDSGILAFGGGCAIEVVDCKCERMKGFTITIRSHLYIHSSSFFSYHAGLTPANFRPRAAEYTTEKAWG